MGTKDVASGPDDGRMRAFTQAVLDDLQGLEKMIEDGCFESGVRRIGARHSYGRVFRTRWQLKSNLA